MRQLSTLKALPLIVAACIPVYIAPGLGHAADLKAGQALHNAHCLKCHDSELYTRPDRHIATLDSLRQQVQRCDTNLGLTWFEDEIENVTQYLNATYYKVE
ncbi:MAG: cytochrome c [Gammaproteobacteria bacterium]|nr:cytochrome c [Gammaproteobacteria bacterium]